MVVGFDYLSGHYAYEHPGVGVNYQQFMPSQWSKKIGDYYFDMAYQGYFEGSVIEVKNWATGIHLFAGKMRVLGYSATDNQLLEKLFDYGVSATKDQVKERANNFVSKKLLNDLYKPAIVFTPNYILGGNKEQAILSGVSNYGGISSKHVKIGTVSAGITIQIGGGGSFSIKPYMPLRYSLDNCSAFGAVKYNNRWYGIRQYLD